MACPQSKGAILRRVCGRRQCVYVCVCVCMYVCVPARWFLYRLEPLNVVEPKAGADTLTRSKTNNLICCHTEPVLKSAGLGQRKGKVDSETITSDDRDNQGQGQGPSRRPTAALVPYTHTHAHTHTTKQNASELQHRKLTQRAPQMSRCVPDTGLQKKGSILRVIQCAVISRW